MTLGTLSSPRFGGPSRVWSDGVYLPVAGPAGARARASDLLIQSLMPQLLSDPGVLRASKVTGNLFIQ